MRNTLFALLLFVLTVQWTPFNPVYPQPLLEAPKTAIEKQHRATHKISFSDVLSPEEGGHCTATAVGPHALLTAQHCFADTNEMYLDKSKKPSIVSFALIDGNDHVIYIMLDETFEYTVPIEQRKLVPNEPVHFWGAPKKLDDVYRDGYFRQDGDMRWVKTGMQQFILPCYPGDSGAAILDADGHVIAAITGGDGADELSLPLEFTSAQLDIAITGGAK